MLIARAARLINLVILVAGVFVFPASAQSVKDTADAERDSGADTERERTDTERSREARRDLYVTGSLEIGRALSSTANDTTGVVLAAGRKPATTLSGSLALDFGRFSLFGIGGASLSQSNEGGFGRLATAVDVMRSPEGISLLQVGADLTHVFSPSLPSLKAAGLTVTAGDPSIFSSSLRVGGRWRAGTFTPATSLEIGRLFTHSIRSSSGASSLLSAYIHSSAVMTSAPLPRNFTIMGGNVVQVENNPIVRPPTVQAFLQSQSAQFTTRRSVTVGDIGGNVQLASGSWILGLRAVARVGSSVSLWDDPVPSKGYLRQDHDGRVGVVARGMWFALPNLAITAEAGRQLSDPIMGFSGLRYASLSAKMSFESGKNPYDWWRKKQFREAAAILREVRTKSQIVSRRLDAYDNNRDDASKGRGSLIGREQTKGLGSKATERIGSRAEVWYEFAVDVPAADSVEIAGDFSGWEPKALSICESARTSNGGKMWCGKFKLAPGVYKVVYRVNGGEWEVPDGLSRIADGFDGEVGLLIVK